ncbi:MAG: hypothetical protein U9N08_02075, partial [Candidatus Caldatribacteriota bacterium]|nr:hypothetical protein [Candidatus Caldatribacteriota bacterium]
LFKLAISFVFFPQLFPTPIRYTPTRVYFLHFIFCIFPSCNFRPASSFLITHHLLLITEIRDACPTGGEGIPYTISLSAIFSCIYFLIFFNRLTGKLANRVTE